MNKWFLQSCPSVLVVLNPLVLGEILFGTSNQHIVSLRAECLWQELKSYCIVLSLCNRYNNDDNNNNDNGIIKGVS